MHVHHKVLSVKTRDPPAKSTCSNSQEIHSETVEGLQELETPQSDELVKLLNKPHVKVGTVVKLGMGLRVDSDNFGTIFFMKVNAVALH